MPALRGNGWGHTAGGHMTGGGDSFTCLRGWIMATAISGLTNNKSPLVCLRVNTEILRAAGQAAKERRRGEEEVGFVLFSSFFKKYALLVLWLP